MKNIQQHVEADFLFIKRTFAGLLLGSLAAAVAQTRYRLDIALADRWRMKHQLGWTGQANRKSCCAHEDARNTWIQPADGKCETISIFRFSRGD